MAASADRQTPGSPTRVLPPATLAAATTVYAGTMVAKIPAGTHKPAADAAGYVVRGIAMNKAALPSTDLVADEVVIAQGPFDVVNSGTDPVTVADIGQWVYVEDDQTIKRKPGTYGRRAGILEDVPSATVATVFFGAPQMQSDAMKAFASPVASGAVDPDIGHSFISTNGTTALTLANGTFPGQRVSLEEITATGTPHGVLTPATATGFTSIEFNTVGDCAVLVWNGAAWYIDSQSGCTIA